MKPGDIFFIASHVKKEAVSICLYTGETELTKNHFVETDTEELYNNIERFITEKVSANIETILFELVTSYTKGKSLEVLAEAKENGHAKLLGDDVTYLGNVEAEWETLTDMYKNNDSVHTAMILITTTLNKFFKTLT